MHDVNDRYPALLQRYEEEARQRRLLATEKGIVLPSAEPTPSELAYTQILKDMPADFPNLTWDTLRNKHSAWKKGHFHPVENDTDPVDYEDEIERLFPSKPQS